MGKMNLFCYLLNQKIDGCINFCLLLLVRDILLTSNSVRKLKTNHILFKSQSKCSKKCGPIKILTKK